MADLFDLPTRRVAGRASSGGPGLLVIAEGGVTLHPLGAGEVVIGRSSSCDVRIDDDSISRQHARLQLSPAGATLIDLGSANGSKLGGRALAPNTPTPLRPGDSFELGTVMVVLQGDAAPAGAVRDDDRLIDRVAASQVNVLIVGETGSGKERLAERLHAGSKRTAGPLVKLNCAALAEGLLEAELFGHEKGAFTGAVAARAGLIEAAHRGTLLLDEVGELPPSTQAKLLRAIEQREVMRVGSTKTIAVDVRFLAATHRDLPAMVAQHGFRADLYYRLDGISLRVPPLRERAAELPQIAADLLAEAAKREELSAPPRLAADALAAMAAYAWPGNIRELRNVLDRALLRWEDGPITAAHLPELGGAPVAPADLRDDVDAFEKKRVLEVLDRCGGNQGKAARELGVSRRTLVRRLGAWGLTKR